MKKITTKEELLNTSVAELCKKYGSKVPAIIEDEKSKLIIGEDFIFWRTK